MKTLSELSDKQLVARIRGAARRGVTPRAYCIGAALDYGAVYYRLNRAGLWNDVMAAKYAAPVEVPR